MNLGMVSQKKKITYHFIFFIFFEKLNITQSVESYALDKLVNCVNYDSNCDEIFTLEEVIQSLLRIRNNKSPVIISQVSIASLINF